MSLKFFDDLNEELKVDSTIKWFEELTAGQNRKFWKLNLPVQYHPNIVQYYKKPYILYSRKQIVQVFFTQT